MTWQVEIDHPVLKQLAALDRLLRSRIKYAVVDERLVVFVVEGVHRSRAY